MAGALTQEIIDVLAVLNALRASFTPRVLTDYDLTPTGSFSAEAGTLAVRSGSGDDGGVDVEW